MLYSKMNAKKTNQQQKSQNSCDLASKNEIMFRNISIKVCSFKNNDYFAVAFCKSD